MMTFMYMLQTMMMVSMINVINPMLLSVQVMLVSITIFATMYLSSGVLWFPMTMFLMFMGGILITFLILSSIEPNKKLSKGKKWSKMSMMVLLAILYVVLWKPSRSMTAPVQTLKMTVFEDPMMVVIVSAIMLYFLTFIYLMKKEKSTLRSLVCQ